MVTATITRAKTGNIQTFEDGKLVSEVTPEGVSVARILIEPTESGLGIKRSRPVRTQQEVAISIQAEQTQAEVSRQLEGTRQEARVVVTPSTGEARAVPVLSRTKELARQRITSRQEIIPLGQIRSRREVEAERKAEQQKKLQESARSFAIKKQTPEGFQAGADPRLILGGEFDTAKSVALGVGGVGLTAAGAALTPFTAGGSTLLIGVGGGLAAKGVARGQEELFGTRLTQKERELITQPQFVEAFGSSILQSQEEFKKRNPILTGEFPFVSPKGAAKRVGGALNIGISASPEDFGKSLRSQLKLRGFTPEEVETGLRIGQERRTIGVISDVIETVGAGVSVEKAGRLALTKAGTTLGSRVATTGVLGAIEAPLLTSGQARATGLETSLSQLAVSSALGAASAGAITGVIGRTGQAGKLIGGKKGQKLAETGAERGFFTIDPTEAIVDIATTLGEKGTRRPRISVTPITGDAITTQINIPKRPKGTERFEGFQVVPVPGERIRTPKVTTPSIPLAQTSRTEQNIFSQPRPRDKPVKPREQPTSFTDVFSQPSTRATPSTFTSITPFTSTRPTPFTSPRTQVTTFSDAGFLTLPPRRGGVGFGLGDGKLSKREKQYVASLAAVGLNITGEASEGAELTGLGLRPIQRKKKTKRKKQK